MSLIRRTSGRAARGVAGDPTWPEKCPEILRRRAAGETLKAIGESMGLGKERVRQIEFLCKRHGRRAEMSRAAAFDQLAGAQRGAPEEAMMRLTMANLAQEYGWLCEHVGDLTNRMAQHWENGCWDWGVGVTGEKVKKTLRVLRRGATLQRSILPQIKSDIRFQQEQGSVKGYPTTETAALRKLRALGKDYAQAHEALTVWNELQGHARDAAVALGRFDFDGAVTHLEALESVLNQDDEVWCIEAGKYTGEPV